jgi:SAM-dependent methyltransferase
LEVLEHLEEPYSVISEFFRVIRKGGLLIMSTPNKDYPLASMLGKWKSMLEQGNDEWELAVVGRRSEMQKQHISVRGLAEWKSLLERSGFLIESVHRGALLYGSPFLDEHPLLFGTIVILDSFLDHVPCSSPFSFMTIVSARRPMENKGP